jgi:hypothetical protein
MGVPMRRWILIAVLPLLFAAGSVRAERPISGGMVPETTISAGELQATPEMWFYEQSMREYKNPQACVRASAVFAAEQRARRIESRRWFGMSNSRPTASPDPYNSDYAPHWVSSPGYYPNRWSGMTGR